MLRLLRWTALAVICLALPASSSASSIVITFEGLRELDVVANQLAGLLFTNAKVVTAGSTVNEFEFPAHSGVNVIFDDGGPISVSFSSPVAAFGGFFTYGVPLTLTAFTASHVSLGVVTSAFGSNDGLFGDPSSSPNEFLQISSALGIASVTIAGDQAGGSFVLDDATITTQATPVPELGTLTLVATGLIGTARAFCRKRRATLVGTSSNGDDRPIEPR